jgi:acetate kinase
MMGTRSGDLDPGILLYLMKEKGFDTGQIDQLVNHKAGLLGVSGISPDMKTLLDQRGNKHSDQAINMFCYQIRKYVGALAAVLGGVDILVFTGGIGEKAAPVRWNICQGLEHLGMRLDPEKNDSNADTISAQDSLCMIRVLPTKEDLMIARHTYRLILGS